MYINETIRKHSKYKYTYYQNTHTLQNPHIHTPTHYKPHTYTHPQIHTPYIIKQVKTTTVQDTHQIIILGSLIAKITHKK